ncbi:MAG: FAD-binding oxidoreductase [Pseudomonadota bacterium]
MSEIVDFAVVGAGIAGASIASELASSGQTVLLEMERQAGYHTTGRSAAMFAPAYGPPPIRALTRASAAFFDEPPQGFTETPLLSPRDTLLVARHDQQDTFNAVHRDLSMDGSVTVLDADALASRYPLLADGYAENAILDRNGSDIDVAALHQGYLRSFKAKGGDTRLSTEVRGLRREASVWHISTPGGELRARTVINAAGAWGETLGRLAGAEAVGLVPKRRTAMTIAAPEDFETRDYPLIVDIAEQFYLKPETGGLLISPANEDPEQPCDVRPDEMDIALCIDRIERAFKLSIKRIDSKWSGLRSFVADKCPVVGYSDVAPAFFWFVGQGGYGIQSAPAMGRLGAALATGSDVPADILAEGLSVMDLAPERLAQAA